MNEITTYCSTYRELSEMFDNWLNARFGSRDPENYPTASMWFLHNKPYCYEYRMAQWALDRFQDGSIKISPSLLNYCLGEYE